MFQNAGPKQYFPYPVENILRDTKEPTGFVSRTTSTLSFTDGNRTFTITPTSGTFAYYVAGVLINKPTDSVQITNTEGPWYIYYVGHTLTASQTVWDLSTTQVPVSALYWDATNAKHLTLTDERHGVVMDWATHKYLHTTIGTRYRSGLTLGDYVIGNGSLDTHAQVSVANGIIEDEDIEFTIADGSPQDIAPIAKLPVFYRSGANAWRVKTATNFPMYENAGATCSYNQNNAGSWQLTPMTSTNYFATWIFATTDVEKPIIAILGQTEDTSVANARANNTYESMSFGALPFQEMKVLYRLIFQTATTLNNTPKARLIEIQDYRSVSNVPASTYVATAHSALTGLTNPDHPGTAVYTNVTNFGKYLSATETTVQSALDILDDHQGYYADKSGTQTRVLTKYMTGTLGSSGTNAVAHGITTPDTNIMEVSVYVKNASNKWCISKGASGILIGALGTAEMYYYYDDTNVTVNFGSTFNSGAYKIVIKYFG